MDKFTHIQDISFNKIMKEIYKELKENKIGVYEQPVQHYDVLTLGWIDIEIKLWTGFFR